MEELLNWIEAEARGLDKEQANSDDNNLRREGMMTAVRAVHTEISKRINGGSTEEATSVEREALEATDEGDTTI